MMAKNRHPIDRIKTGVPNLDELFHGGLPVLSVSVVGGTPGSGKTIFTQQICFANATPQRPALIVQTLSEPTAKTLRYLAQFDYFDPAKLEDGSVQFADLGGILRKQGLSAATSLLMEQFKKVKPAFVVIDSFKVFSDLAPSREEIRKFTYEIAIGLKTRGQGP